MATGPQQLTMTSGPLSRVLRMHQLLKEVRLLKQPTAMVHLVQRRRLKRGVPMVAAIALRPTTADGELLELALSNQ